MVLLHGLGKSPADWGAVLARLARSRAVYAPALPGFDGHGDAADVSAEGHARFLGRFLDAVGLRRAVLVGHSLGGLAALLFALASPGRVTALCLAEQYRLARQPGFLDATLATLRDQVGPTGQRRVLLDRLGALRMLMLLVWGDQDRVVPVAQARRAAARLPDADMVVLSGCGYVPHVEDPAAFARADQSVARSAPRRRRRRAAAPAIR